MAIWEAGPTSTFPIRQIYPAQLAHHMRSHPGKEKWTPGDEVINSRSPSELTFASSLSGGTGVQLSHIISVFSRVTIETRRTVAKVIDTGSESDPRDFNFDAQFSPDY